MRKGRDAWGEAQAHHDRERARVQDRWREVQARYENDLALARAGWKVWPDNATQEEQDAALEMMLNGGDYAFYPPGTVVEQVDTTGKLDVPADSEPRKWWEVWK